MPGSPAGSAANTPATAPRSTSPLGSSPSSGRCGPCGGPSARSHVRTGRRVQPDGGEAPRAAGRGQEQRPIGTVPSRRMPLRTDAARPRFPGAYLRRRGPLLGDGHRQRDARLLLGRRALPRCRSRDRARASAGGEGAAILDVGGESTRPGAEPVPAAEEWRARAAGGRAPRGAGHCGSRSTRPSARWPGGARGGRPLVNDVSAFRFAPSWPGVVAAGRRGLLPDRHAGRAAHDAGGRALRRRGRRGEGLPRGAAGLRGGEGVPEERVWLDPGIGFGKTVEHNLELLRRLDEVVAIGRPVVIGTSRKSFLGKLAGGAARTSACPARSPPT